MSAVLAKPSPSRATQRYRRMAVASPLGEDVLLLRQMQASEQLGRLFEYRLDLLSEDQHIALEDVLGVNMTVRLEPLDDGETRYFNGYVSEFRYAGTQGRYAMYQATLRPWLWFLTQNADCRIFQNRTVPEIIEELLGNYQFSSFRARLSDEYRRWEYCVQYRETDFQFISRLMEQEGIYYYFKHHNGRHELILADSYSAHGVVPGYESIPYYPPDTHNHRERDHISEWSVARQMRSGAYALCDYDFEAPRKDLQVRLAAPVHPLSSPYEVFDYPGEFANRGEGERYARVRLEELQTCHETVQGEGNAQGITVGALFELYNYPRPESNQKYLVIAADYQLRSDYYETTGGGDNDYLYHCRFTAIDSRQPYRSPRVTPKPVVQGPQTAIVVGKANEEIWTDRFGRVKVQFHWDRYSKADESSSCWIRVAQVWAGKRWGAMYVPRIGQEVIVDFLEGDPDRPIITGRVYNGSSLPPYDLPQRATLSTIKSHSSKGGGGFNEIRFEDQKGEEQIFVHAERNQDLRVKNDRYEWIGRNRHLIVKQDKFETIENSRHEVVDRDHREDIGNDRNLKVGGKQAIAVGGSHSFTVNGNVIEVFQGDHSEQVSGNCYLKANGLVIEALSGITLKCGASNIVLDSAGITLKGATVTIDGGLVKIASGPGSQPAAGIPGNAVAPATPEPALEADNADPGQMDEIKARERRAQRGKYGSVPVTPFKPYRLDATGQPLRRPEGSALRPKPTRKPEQPKPHWIEIELYDEADQPVPGEKYRITLPDGQVVEGTLDDQGWARVDGIEPGTAQVTFPNLDQEAWEFIKSLGPRGQGN